MRLGRLVEAGDPTRGRLAETRHRPQPRGRIMMFRAVVAAALSLGMLATVSVGASAQQQQQSRQVSQKVVGPWQLIGFINSQNVAYCVAVRQVGEATVMFARFQHGYGVAVQSPNFWFTRGAVVRVRVAATPMSDNTVDGQAVTGQLVLAQLTSDPAVMREMAGLPQIVVSAEGQNVAVPLDGLREALNDLDSCAANNGQLGSTSAEPSAPPSPPASPAPPAPGAAPSPPVHRFPIPGGDKRIVPIMNVAPAIVLSPR
jgi:hypothetical protein